MSTYTNIHDLKYLCYGDYTKYFNYSCDNVGYCFSLFTIAD